MAIGTEMYQLAGELFPICRSLTGNGVRQTLQRLKAMLPSLTIHEVPTGTKVFDWTIPNEWNIRDAYVVGPDGRKVIDFKQSNLHVMGYSVPVDATLPLEELQEHLYSLPDSPHAIPYITSYYKERWGFCLRHSDREKLVRGEYRVVVDSDLKPGSLTYGELIIPGDSAEEIFLSTYVCHPSMANNELSGPVVVSHLAKWLLSLPNRRYTYRIVFIPETIGSITYLSRNFEQMKKRVIAGFNVSCVGDDRCYSYLPSRLGNTLADSVALHVLKHVAGEIKRYSFLDRGSDERQYCSPGVDLPVCCIMRSKYGEYPEYHTSLDNMDLITAEGLEGSYEAYRKCITLLERNEVLRTSVLCEPQLGKRGLYPTLSTRSSALTVSAMMDLLAYADGTRDLVGIAETIGQPAWELYDTIDRLKEHGLLTTVIREEQHAARA